MSDRTRGARAWMLGIVCGAVLGLASCTANIANSAPITPLNPRAQHAPVMLSLWGFFTGREAGVVDEALKGLHRRYPWLTVRQVQGKTDDDVLRGINSGHPPDLALLGGPANLAKFCDAGALRDVRPVAARDHLNLAATFPRQVLSYATHDGKVCALPMLADAYGLYYNKSLLAKAGYHQPPRTLSQLTTMAKKLTTYNPDGSIKVAAYVPLSTFYESVHALQGNYFGAAWYHGGRATLDSPAWVKGLTWEKKLIDAIGYTKLSQFAATLGAESEYATNNGFEAGKVAMEIDGEWRVAFAKADKSKVDYGVAPFPVSDDRPDLYGSGQVQGTLIGIPAGVPHAAASWVAMRFLTTDTQTLDKLSAGLQNVPTTYASLRSARFAHAPLTRNFVKILMNPHSAWKQPTTAGQVDVDLLASFLTTWEAGKVSSLTTGLRQLSKNIDTQTAIR